MATQITMSTHLSTVSPSVSQPIQSVSSDPNRGLSTPSCKMESMKYLYQADQQVKYLHLQAEIESLLIELQTVKQLRSSDVPVRELQGVG